MKMSRQAMRMRNCGRVSKAKSARRLHANNCSICIWASPEVSRAAIIANRPVRISRYRIYINVRTPVFSKRWTASTPSAARRFAPLRLTEYRAAFSTVSLAQVRCANSYPGADGSGANAFVRWQNARTPTKFRPWSASPNSPWVWRWVSCSKVLDCSKTARPAARTRPIRPMRVPPGKRLSITCKLNSRPFRNGNRLSCDNTISMVSALTIWLRSCQFQKGAFPNFMGPRCFCCGDDCAVEVIFA